MPNFVVRHGFMFDSSYVFQRPASRSPKGRYQKAIGKEALEFFGSSEHAFLQIKGVDPFRRVPLVIELETGHPVVSGYAFIGDWLAHRIEKRINHKSRLAPGMATGVPWK